MDAEDLTAGSRCNACGAPTVKRTRLCATHYAEGLERARRSLGKRDSSDARRRSAPPKPPPPKRPERVVIDPSDVFDADGQRFTAAEDRAMHVALWVHRVGRAVSRADAIRVAG